MRITDFDLYKDLLKAHAGLVITPDQSYLLDSRLGVVAKKWNFPGIQSMTNTLLGVPDKELIRDIVEAMVESDTCFFRDLKVFNLFGEKIIPILKSRRPKGAKLKIWSAGCAGGQEPYSIAMSANEIPNTAVDILATDLSATALEEARKGRYARFEVQHGLPVRYLIKYFRQKDDHKWEIVKLIRSMVQFEEMNLLHANQVSGPFDVIFCRYALGGIEESDQLEILEGLSAHLAPDGFLFLGIDEPGLNTGGTFRPLPDTPGIYVPPGSPYPEKGGLEAAGAEQALAQ